MSRRAVSVLDESFHKLGDRERLLLRSVGLLAVVNTRPIWSPEPEPGDLQWACFTPEPLTIVHFIQYRPSTAPPRAAEWLASSHTKGLLQPRPREAGAAPRTAGQLEEEQRACGTRERQSHWWDLQGGPVRTSRGRRGHREHV